MLKFEWDPVKAKSNRKKHGVTFAEASSCFYDPMHILINDPDSAADEDRLILIGASSKSQILVVVHVDISGDTIRIISARKATKAERKQYEEV
ncbi:MAG: hypothetical protein RJB66_2549 [Pseudomonadota bacterium]|jgi:uncharacterized DUF497 family protein